MKERGRRNRLLCHILSNTGDNSAPNLTVEDLDGNLRLGDGKVDGNCVVDMGAYEFLPADIDGSGVVNLLDLSKLAMHWAETDCRRCGWANLDWDGRVDSNDLVLLTDWWLAGAEGSTLDMI